MLSSYHGVKANRPVPLGKVDDIPTVSGEFATEKSVHDHHLNDDIEQVEDLRHEVKVKVTIVLVGVRLEVVGHHGEVLLLALINDGRVEVLDELRHTTAFKGLPEVAGHVEEECLEEEHKANPLVVGVPHFGLIGRRLVDSRVGHLFANSLLPRILNAEGRVDPTVRVCGRKKEN